MKCLVEYKAITSITTKKLGRVYGGTQDGKIMRLLSADQLEVFADTGARPLGLQFDRRQKRQLSKLPKSMWPKPTPCGLVLALDERGTITRSLHDPTGIHLMEVTSIREHGGFLYLGSLHNDRIGKFRLPGIIAEEYRTPPVPE